MFIRSFDAHDSYTALTSLLHRAYAPLAAQGMHFFASHQSEEQTRERAEQGRCFVSEGDGTIEGTITVYDEQPRSSCEWYRRPGVWVFGQFAVDPPLQRTGIGAALLRHAETVARAGGAAELACDTAEGASRLISYYASHGFRRVGYTQWDEVNYRSVILSKVL